MDILTLGKMNAMARDVDVTLEYLANATFQGMKDICEFQEGNLAALNQAAQDGIDAMNQLDPSSTKTKSLYIGCHRFNGSMGQEGLNYGGWQCNWVVPEGTQSIKFEIYGSGASGYGGCCCMMNPLPGGAGAYAVKHLNKPDGDFVIGDTYAMCAGGTGCCWPHQHGVRGHTSYITGSGLSNFCAQGGHPAINSCASFNCYTCCHTCFGCAAMWGADYGVSGRSSWRKSSHHCANSMFQVAATAGGPIGQGGDSFSPDACVFGYHSGGGPSSPGGGAYGGAVSWPCCCGKAGGAGAVLVTYWG